MVDYRDWSHDPRGTPQGDRGDWTSGDERAGDDTWVPRQRSAGDDGYPPAGYRRVEPAEWPAPEPRWATTTDPALPRYSEYWQPPSASADPPQPSYPPASEYADRGYGQDAYEPGQHRATYVPDEDAPSAGRYPSRRYDEPTERFSGRQYPPATYGREPSGGYAEPSYSDPPYSTPPYATQPYPAPPQTTPPPYSAPPRQSGRHSAVPYPTSGPEFDADATAAYRPYSSSPYPATPYSAPPEPGYGGGSGAAAYPESRRSVAPRSAAPYSAPPPQPAGYGNGYGSGYGQDAPTESIPRADGPYPTAPYSAPPQSVAPRSAAPYSAAPYSAAPYSAAPYSAAPRSAAPYRPPAPYTPRRGSSYPPATGRASIAVIEPGDPERRFGSVLAWTFSWFLVPLVLFLGWTLTLDGTAAAECVDAFGAPCLAPRAQALTTLIGALPAAAGAFVVSLLVGLGLRPLTTWRAPTIGFAAAVVGSGIATIIGTSL